MTPEGAGAWYPPTVLVGCTDDMTVMRDETFGPVAAVRVVSSFDEGLAAAARSTYGLAATVLTPSMEHAQRAARELPVGTVKVNAVFGGAPGGVGDARPGDRPGLRLRPRAARRAVALQGRPLGAGAGLGPSPRLARPGDHGRTTRSSP